MPSAAENRVGSHADQQCSHQPEHDVAVEHAQQLEDMQRQMSTGQKAASYGTLGAGRTQSITFRSKLSEIGGYLQNTDVLNMRISLLDKSMSRLEDIPRDAAAAIDPNTYDLDSTGTTTPARRCQDRAQ